MENQVATQNQKPETGNDIRTDAPEKFPVIPFAVFCIGFAGTLYSTMPAGVVSFGISLSICGGGFVALYYRSTPSRLASLLVGVISLLGCCIIGTRTPSLLHSINNRETFSFFVLVSSMCSAVILVVASFFSAYSLGKALEFKKAAREKFAIATMLVASCATLLGFAAPLERDRHDAIHAVESAQMMLNEWHQEAKKGDVHAQRMLGMIYDNSRHGYGVEWRNCNQDLAIYWYQKAALQGDEFSRKKLQYYSKLSDRPDKEFLVK